MMYKDDLSKRIVESDYAGLHGSEDSKLIKEIVWLLVKAKNSEEEKHNETMAECKILLLGLLETRTTGWHRFFDLGLCPDLPKTEDPYLNTIDYLSLYSSYLDQDGPVMYFLAYQVYLSFIKIRTSTNMMSDTISKKLDEWEESQKPTKNLGKKK